jgi:hypothetical protein
MKSQETKDFRQLARQIPVTFTSAAQNLWLCDGGIELNQNIFNDGGRRIPWNEVASFEVDGADTIQSRITATRIVALGVFALAAKKKTGSSFLTISLVNGESLLFEVPKISAPELRSRLQPYQVRLNSAPVVSVTSAAIESAADELLKMAELLDKGLLTADEFAEQKKRLLGS